MLRFGILGPVEVYDADGRAVPLVGPRQMRLLALLLVHADRAVSADQLRDALWGSERPRGVDKRLQMAIARLRKALDDAAGASAALRTVVGGYRLVAAPDELDAHVFEASVRAGRRALDASDPGRAIDMLDDALALWRGPALADVSHEDWAQPEIRRLDELRLDAVQASVDAKLQLGRHETVIGDLDAVVARHPQREQLVGRLMVALYRSGRQAEALDVYQRTRRQLAPFSGKRRTTGMKKGMKESYIEDPANHGGPESWKAPDNRHEEGNGRVLHRRSSESRWPRPCVGDPRGRSEALDRGARRPAMQPRNGVFRGADAFMTRGRRYRGRRFREPSADPAGSENPSMRVISSC
jgi:DNA-binding SARP family transcriptional activator